MKIVQINSVIGFGSTGRIMVAIHNELTLNGHKGYMVYGRNQKKTFIQSPDITIKIGNIFSLFIHGLLSRLFDLHGLGSWFSTKKLIKKLSKIQPDIIHLHNIHGYYIHYPHLFDYIHKNNIPVVWTFHDNWPFTGHCSSFDEANCNKWTTGCGKCPLLKSYPKSILFDNSRLNYRIKRDVFLKINNLTIITPSKWLENNVKKSFFKSNQVMTIHNGINLSNFKPNPTNIYIKHDIIGKFIVVCVANYWTNLKGLNHIIKLSEMIDNDIQIVMIGVDKKIARQLPRKILTIQRTNNVNELAHYYSSSDVFLNPTLSDNFPTTNLEALACGTPVITYETGGSPESITDEVGVIVPKGDTTKLYDAIIKIKDKGKKFYTKKCVEKSLQFDENKVFKKYISVYESIKKLN